MRKIKYIVVHCTAGSQRQTVGDLLSEFSRKGWRNPGYHVVIMPDGSRRQLLDFSRIANGVRGHNADAIHVAYVGGIDAHGHALDNRTEAQKAALKRELVWLRARYGGAKIVGHRDLSPDKNGDGVITPNEYVKQCPCFDAKKEYGGI